MSTPQDRAKAYLNEIGGVIGRALAAGDRLDSQIVELDIEKVRLLANAGLHWAKERESIQAACKVLGIDEDKWCRETWGRSIVTLRGYRQIGREWGRYLTKRRELGETGHTGIELARSLVPMNARGTNARVPSVCSETLDISLCNFITDGALSALRKMPSESVDVMPTSPPYYPIKRDYGGPHGGRAVGYEPTLEEYLTRLVTTLHEAKRVLTKRGTLIVIMRDSYATNTGQRHRPHTYKLRSASKQKESEWRRTGIRQHLDRPHGNLLLIPTRFALKMQDDGWILRMVLPARVHAQPESVEDRTSHDYDWILVFAKQRDYFWNKDAIRLPHTGVSDMRVPPNPTGKNASSVLEFEGSRYKGKHPATTPIGMARWILSAACDDNAHVCDPFGGAGTFAMLALQMGYTATTIDINEEYTKEAKERLAKSPAKLPDNEK